MKRSLHERENPTNLNTKLYGPYSFPLKNRDCFRKTLCVDQDFNNWSHGTYSRWSDVKCRAAKEDIGNLGKNTNGKFNAVLASAPHAELQVLQNVLGCGESFEKCFFCDNVACENDHFISSGIVKRSTHAAAREMADVIMVSKSVNSQFSIGQREDGVVFVDVRDATENVPRQGKILKLHYGEGKRHSFCISGFGYSLYNFLPLCSLHNNPKGSKFVLDYACELHLQLRMNKKKQPLPAISKDKPAISKDKVDIVAKYLQRFASSRPCLALTKDVNTIEPVFKSLHHTMQTHVNLIKANLYHAGTYDVAAASKLIQTTSQRLRFEMAKLSTRCDV